MPRNIMSIEVYAPIVEFESFISQLESKQIALQLSGNKYAALNGIKEFIEEWARQSEANQCIFNFATTAFYIPQLSVNDPEPLIAAINLAEYIRNRYPNSYKVEAKVNGNIVKRGYSDMEDSSSHLPHKNSSSARLF